ncbi:MAG: UDP-N-acetylmuramoyl-L-alanine--D-glutamate ligase [Treponema sp.]|nr:UDP-N-acetylmuramoyl-L-alanine--D-glutamate ligase [Treponema sp.]
MDYRGIKALVMGLGLHGGGLATARFLLERGAEVTVTDLRDEKVLQPSIEELDASCRKYGKQPVRYILGKHEIEDFKNADMVVKNPGVRPDSPFLLASKLIETDLSIFLQESAARLFAVTGTKGKSGTASSLHHILSFNRKKGKSFLGGNITVSPLTFLNELTENDDVVLELSSFQLGDIKNRRRRFSGGQDESALLKPKAAILTAIMHDHLDRYASMNEYIDDKRNIYRGQDESCVTIAYDDDWGKSFHAETKGRPLIVSGKRDLRSALSETQSGGWIDENGRGLARLFNWEGVGCETAELVPAVLLTPGEHQKQNLLSAALAAYSFGAEAESIRSALAEYRGIEHRLELFHEANGVKFYNDSAATIPEAAAACVEALHERGLVLVTGGTDKNLDFSPLANSAHKAKAVILLAGTGSDKLARLLRANNVSFNGPFDDLEKAVNCCLEKAESGNAAVLSPGCASFGMFLNEFDRGRKWKDAVKKLS